MSAFNEAYRALLARDMKCPACGEMNVPKASLTIELDQTGTRAECRSCSFEGLLSAFLPKGFVA